MIKNKNIIITGALGLLGKSLTAELAQRGANIIMLDIKNKKQLKEIQNLNLIKNKINYIKCNVSNIKSVIKTDKILKRKF